MAALLATALKRLASPRGPHANAESMRLSPTPSVRLKCAFQISLLPTLNLLIGSDRYNNLAGDSSQDAGRVPVPGNASWRTTEPCGACF